MTCVCILSAVCPALPHFFHIISQTARYWGGGINIKRAFWFYIQFLPETFLARYDVTVLQAVRSRVGFPMGFWRFFIDLILSAALWPGVDLPSNGNKHQGCRKGDKSCCCAGLTTLPPSRAHCLQILEASTSRNPKDLSRPVWFLHVKSPFFFSDFNETLNFLYRFSRTPPPQYKMPWKFVQWESCSSMQTHRHEEANNGFSQFC